MPEVPDLEAIRHYLNQRIIGEPITRAEIVIPIISRVTKEDFAESLEGNEFTTVERYGKFLLFQLASDQIMIVNAMLTGRFQYLDAGEKKRGRTCAVIEFANGRQLRYSDFRLMGKLYLVKSADLSTVPQFAEMGPDVLDPALTEQVFRERIRKHPGQIKSILVNHKFIAGIGNAYSDEILFVAGLHPYRKRTSLSDDEIGRLYHAIHEVLDWAIPIVEEKMKDGLSYEERREHLRVHRLGGKPCPNCGSPISEITAGERVTSFCRTCQGDREPAATTTS